MTTAVDCVRTDHKISATARVPSTMLGALDRKRMLEHIIGDMVHQVLSSPGSDPDGLTIHVHLVNSSLNAGEQELAVTAETPRYELL